MRTKTKALLSVAATACVLAATLGVPAAQSPAEAAPSCSGPTTRLNGEGMGTTFAPGNLKSGPYAACRTVQGLRAKTKVYYHCSYQNAYGNIWLYVRVAGGSTHGWLPLTNLHQSAGGDDDGDGTVEIAWCA